uniref:Uncharacterized protein n=1 Tax=Bursaphelenchus xylophilus TaxID=6326 RepID=A0A1I7SVG2_BURXY
MMEKVLRNGPLQFYQYYLNELEPREEPDEIQVTEEIARFLLSSRRIHNTLYVTSQSIYAWDDGFSVGQDDINYFHQNPIILATLSLLHLGKDPCFRIVRNDAMQEGGDVRMILKFMYWAKRNSFNFLLHSELQDKVLSQVMDDLGYEYEYFDRFGDINYFHYVQDLNEVLNKSAEDQITVFIYFKPTEGKHPCRKVYLHGLFGHPKMTALTLVNCDGFVLCQYLPFPPMPNLQRIYARMPFGSIESTFAFPYYHDLLADFELKAPLCRLRFDRRIDVTAASYDVHLGVLQQLATAMKNTIELASRFKNVYFNHVVHVYLPETAQSHRDVWQHFVEQLTPLREIKFEKNCWKYLLADVSVFNGEDTGLRLELEYYFRDVSWELGGQVLRIHDQ